MRTSIWFGILTLALGVGLSYLADALVQTQTYSPLQTTASIIAAVLFILFSASMLGIGAALVAHWILGFFGNWIAFGLEIILSFGAIFMGIGGAIFSGNWMAAIHVFFSFFAAGIGLFALSFISFFGGVFKGFNTIKSYLEKKFKKRDNVKKRARKIR